MNKFTISSLNFHNNININNNYNSNNNNKNNNKSEQKQSILLIRRSNNYNINEFSTSKTCNAQCL